MKKSIMSLLAVTLMIQSSAHSDELRRTEIYPYSDRDSWMIKITEVNAGEIKAELCEKTDISKCFHTIGRKTYSKDLISMAASSIMAKIRRITPTEYAAIVASTGLGVGAGYWRANKSGGSFFAIASVMGVFFGGSAAAFKWHDIQKQTLLFYEALCLTYPRPYQMSYDGDIRDLADQIEELFEEINSHWT